MTPALSGNKISGRAIMITIKLAAVAVVVTLCSSTEVMAVKPKVRVENYYNIVNPIELAPLTTLIDQFLRDECVNPHTVKAYKKALEYFLAFAAKSSRRTSAAVSYHEITRALITQFRDARLKIEAPASAELRLRAVKAFCSWMRERYDVDSPAQRVDNISLVNDDFKGLCPSEYRRLVEAAKREKDPVKRFLPSLYVHTGIRREEGRLLTVGQVSPDYAWLTRVLGKKKKFRNVPYDPDGVGELETYLEWRKWAYRARHDDPLIPSPRSEFARPTPMDATTIARSIGAVGEKAKNSLTNPHALRHTYAYRFLDRKKAEGEDSFRAAAKLRRAMGHSDINTTLIYLGFRRGDLSDPFGEARL